MVDKPLTNRRELGEAKLLLARIPIVRGACELDLLGFLHRHPRTLLTSEQLAVYVGYDMKRIAKSIDLFIGAGLLERTKNRMHAVRMYSLALNGPEGEALAALVKLASTRQGRRDILELFGPEQPQTAPVDTAHENLAG